MGARSPLLKAFGDDFSWSLLDASPDATVIVSGTGELVFVNEHAGDLFGYEVDDLLGRAVEDLLPAGVRAVHRAHRTRYRAEPMVRSMGADLELWARRSDGSEVPVEISLSPLRLGNDVFAIASVRDIAVRVEAEDQLHRVLHTLDSTDDGVFIFDAATMRFQFVNDGAVRLVGYERADLLTMSLLHLNPYTSELDYRRLVRSLLDDRTSSIVRQSILLHRDGREVPVEKTFRSAPTGRDGTDLVIALARDVSVRRAAEAELRQSQAALRAAEQVAIVAEERERIAMGLHDTVIQRLFSEGLRLQGALSVIDDPDRTRARIESCIEGLDRTIHDLRSAIFGLQVPSTAQSRLLDRLLTVLVDASPMLGFEPHLQLAGPIGSLDEEVADQLIPALREALSNIGHHAAARSVRVVVVVDEYATLSVTDDGVGLPAEVVGRAGMLTVAEGARRLGGELTVEPNRSGGSLLTWRVPVARAEVVTAS